MKNNNVFMAPGIFRGFSIFALQSCNGKTNVEICQNLSTLENQIHSLYTSALIFLLINCELTIPKPQKYINMK